MKGRAIFMSRYVSLVGQRFGRLTVLEEVGRNHYGIIYKCECECGNIKEYTAVRLRSKNVQSCGCLRKDRFKTHDLSKTRLYQIFQGMKKRCYNENAQYYAIYGGRGIKICDEWLNDFKTFYDWSNKNGYEDHLSIERINVNGDYEPLNCCWIELNKQAKNRRNVKSIEYEGEVHTVRDLALKVGMEEGTLAYRLRAGWSLEDAINIKPDLANSYLLDKKNKRDEKGRFTN